MTSPIFLKIVLSFAVLTTLSACAQLQSAGQTLANLGKPPAPVVVVYSQAALPAAVQVPRGYQVGLETTGVGEVTYQCRAKADGTPGTAWVFVSPALTLSDASGATVITYTGPPATFAHADGSTITAASVATAPSSAGNLPFQLFKANPADKLGAMMGITHIQRVDNQGGVAPTTPCVPTAINTTERVRFQAKYVFYRSL